MEQITELEKKIKHGWDISAKGYSHIIQDELAPERKLAWLDTILENAPCRDDLKILDAGCGPGFFSIILSEAGFDVTGIDLSANMIKEAEKNAEACEVVPVFRVMDSQDPDFENETFDMIVSRNVVWSLNEPEKAISNWHRILKPGGRLLIFDGDHLKDLREPLNFQNYKYKTYSHDGYSEEYEQIYGHPPKRSYDEEDYEEARGWRTGLPLANEKRPDWDIAVLKKCGFLNVKAEWVNEKVFTDKRDIYLHRHTPYFLVTGARG